MNSEVRFTRSKVNETLDNGKYAILAAKRTGQRVAIRLHGYCEEECYIEEPTIVGDTGTVWMEVDGLYTWAIHHATFIKYIDTI